MVDRIGQQFGNYRLIRLLGTGGFAEVYLAEHIHLGMQAAIKILRAQLGSSEISIFRQEARTIADLKHPHIIRVLDFDVQNGTPFLVLDYASKGSLRSIHPGGNKLPFDRVVKYVKQIAGALQYAHEHRVIHRDVKPENVLLSEHDELLLTDFGIATIAHSTSSMATSATMGTLAYMAPEQIQGKPRPASDQYALAVTVYYWLTGDLPFVGSSAEIIAQHLGAPPPQLREARPDLSAEVEQVVLTALAKDPQDRFDNMLAFARALAFVSGSEALDAPRKAFGAQASIEQGIYGKAGETGTFEPFTLRTGTRHYTVESLLTRGDLCSLYTGTFVSGKSDSIDAGEAVLLKIPTRPADNDLVANEARILGHLRTDGDYDKLRHFVSQLVDNFAYHEKETGAVRNVNVLTYPGGLYTLKEVREAYRGGIDPKDMAWIWRRLLVALGFAHANHVIHGAVLPTHILIHPQKHGVVLIDWSYAALRPAKTGERISAISSAYREWYPAEVFVRQEPTPGLDIAMAGKCMIDLIGGDPHTRMIPAKVPWQLHSYLKGCTLPNLRQRPQDAHQLLKDFDELIERLWGPRTFRAFTMPDHRN